MSAKPSRDPLVGRTVGDFVVRNKIGEGGFGAVYRAEQPALAREAVIKVLHTLNRASQTATERFLREARLASRLDHPFAAHIYAFGVEPDGLLWIAMELVRGTPLDRLLDQHGPIALDKFVPLLERICEVVHTAHEQGIIHRDLKPANVLVLSRAGRYLPKLLDFGIARVLGEHNDDTMTTSAASLEDDKDNESDEGDLSNTIDDNAPPNASLRITTPTPVPDFKHSITRRGAILGSPRYMAPEQWVNVSSADARTDLYAIAALSYEAITGRPPFEADSVLDLAVAHAQHPVPPLGGGLPPELDAVFAKALAKISTDRYASANELAAAFRSASGIEVGRETLPALEDSLRETLIAEAPQPIAEAVAALAAARHAHQAQVAVRECVRVAVRWIGILALASRTRVGPGRGRDAAPVVDALRELRRHGLDDVEWLDLARELCRPFAAHRDAHPIPELVSLFFAELDATTSRESPLEPDLDASSELHGTSEEHARSALATSVPALARFLRKITFLSEYPLVIGHDDRAEVWMGMRRPKRLAMTVSGKTIEGDRPMLCDRDGHPIVTLWPLVQVAAPAAGSAEELFLFDGKGRRGARLLALPRDFERNDESVWQWFGANLLDTLDEAEAPLEQVVPYRGLASFTSNDTGMFFGREREVEGFANRLRAQAFLAVVGPSGSGKSSFVQAGVLPALPPTWRALTIRPGAAPFAALSARLAQDSILSADLAASEDALANAVRAFAETERTTVVLVVDQFEELFTLCADEDERIRFARALAKAGRSADDPVRVIITLRDDFLVSAAELAPLRSRIGQGLEIMATPSRADLLRIVTEPARLVGYDFEDKQLPAEMVDAVASEPGALALLSFSTSTLWELRDRHFKQLTRKAYTAMGGVAGALAQHAEATRNTLSSEEQRLCREAFRHLVTAQGTRAVMTRSDLLQVLDDHALAGSVIDRLIGARLLVASEAEGGDDRIEIIHETLLGAWPRLVDWRREDAEGARMRDQLRAAAHQWQERERPRGLLWRDDALAEYKVWRQRYPGALTAVENEFGNESVAAAERGKRNRRWLLVSAFTILTGLLAIAMWQRGRANENATEARRRVITLNEDQGRLALLDGHPGRALVYLAEAYRLGGARPSVGFMIGRASPSLESTRVTLRHGGKVSDVSYSRDGKRIVIADHDGATVWDVASGERVLRLPHPGDVVKAPVSPDGTRIATVGADGTVRLWDAISGQVLFAWKHGMGLFDGAFSPDGTRLATANAFDGVAKIWDVSSGREIASLKHGEGLRTLAYSPDGTRIATAADRGDAVIWSADGKLLKTIKMPGGGGGDVRWSPDSQSVVAADSDKKARIINLETGQETLLIGHSEDVVAVTYSGDGRYIATGSFDQSARLWDAKTGKFLHSFGGQNGLVWVVRFDPRSERLATAARNGIVQVWDVQTGARLAILDGHSDETHAMVFSPDGNELATGSWDGTARLWRAKPNELVDTWVRGSGQLVTAISADGSKIAFTGEELEAPALVDRITHKTYALGTKVTRAAFSPTGDRLLLGFADGAVKVFRSEGALEGQRERTIVDTNSPIVAVDFSPDGERILAATGEKGVIRVWGSPDLLIPTTEDILTAHFSPDGRHIVVATGGDHRARVWDARTGLPTLDLPRQESWVNAAIYTPDNRQIAAALQNGTVQLWDAFSGKPLGVFERHARPVTTLVFSSDGALLATGSMDHTVALWDVERRKQLAVFRGHHDTIASLSFTKDDAFLLSSDEAGVAKLWDVRVDRRSWADIDRLVRCHVAFQLVDDNLVPANAFRRCSE